MTIKPGDILDLEGMLMGDDGSTFAVKGPVEIIAMGAEPTPPNPGPEPEPDITEKTYRPEDFGGDFAKMQAAILADQKAAGDGLMRAIVQLAKGKTYEYAKNNWLTGVQRYRCEAVGTGDRPKLRCTSTSAMFIDKGPLNLGKGANCFVEPNAPMSKTKAMALIANAKVGDKSVTLLSAADAAKLEPGRWHAVFSYCQQIGGYPPNVRWIDYAQVKSVSGTTVTLDRPLTRNHFADYWEDPNDEMSIGKARIGLWDGFQNDTRCTLEGAWHGLEFVGEGQAGTDCTYIESHISALFEDCKISNFWVSMSKDTVLRNCTFTGAGAQAAEPDKLSGTLTFDGCKQEDTGRYIQGATGFDEVIMKDCDFNSISVSPRKLTVIDSVLDSRGNTAFYVPCNWAFNGPVLEASFTGTDFVCSTPAQATCFYSSAPVHPLPLSAGSWQGNKLIIPRSFGGFEPWLVWLYEGIMLFTGGSVDKPGSYGRVAKIYAPADGSALWLDVDWLVGTKPTNGNLNVPQHGLRKMIWGAGTAISVGKWLDPSYVCLEGTPADRAFPDGIG